MNRELLLDIAERAGRTFLQFYFGAWMLAAGLLDTNFDIPNASAYDLLFTMTNLKAGIVGLALTVAMGLGTAKIHNTDTASVIT